MATIITMNKAIGIAMSRVGIERAIIERMIYFFSQKPQKTLDCSADPRKQRKLCDYSCNVENRQRSQKCLFRSNSRCSLLRNRVNHKINNASAFLVFGNLMQTTRRRTKRHQNMLEHSLHFLLYLLLQLLLNVCAKPCCCNRQIKLAAATNCGNGLVFSTYLKAPVSLDVIAVCRLNLNMLADIYNLQR